MYGCKKWKMNKNDEDKIQMSSKTDTLNEYLRYAGRIQAETATKKYWRLQRWISSARMSEGEDGSSSDTLSNEERI